MSRAEPSYPGSGATSRRLIEGARQGRNSAFDALFHRHFAFLLRYVRGRFPRGRGALSDSQDVVQKAFHRVFAGLSRFDQRGRGALRAYMRQTVDNLIRDELRQIGRQGSIEPLDESIVDPLASPYEKAVAVETEARYRSALSRLASSDQELIVGFVELGYSNAQLAVLSDRPTADAARVALARALRRLAREMARE